MSTITIFKISKLFSNIKKENLFKLKTLRTILFVVFIIMLISVLFDSSLFITYNSNSNLGLKEPNNKMDNNNLRVNTNNRISSNLVPHTEISINNNAGFTTCNCSVGSGTSIDPYIIQNYIISNPTNPGITISSTNAYFVLRNIEIVYANSYGIFLVNVTNGLIDNVNASFGSQPGFDIVLSHNITFSNDILIQNYLGVNFDECQNLTIKDSIISNNSYTGIWNYYSSFDNFINNSIKFNIIGLSNDHSNNSLVIGNIMDYNNYGITFYVSSNDSLYDNLINQNNFGIYFSISNGTETIINNSILNTVNDGITLYEVLNSDIENNFVNNSGLGNIYSSVNGILLELSNSSKIINNELDFNGNGISLTNSSNNTIKSNNLNFNLNYGLSMQSDSDENLILNNNEKNSTNGYWAFLSANNTFINNIANYDSFNGFWIVNSSNNQLITNIANYNNNGFVIDSSNSNLLVNNSALFNRFGFKLYHVSNTHFTNNTVEFSTEQNFFDYDSYNNYFFGNIFIDPVQTEPTSTINSGISSNKTPAIGFTSLEAISIIFSGLMVLTTIKKRKKKFNS